MPRNASRRAFACRTRAFQVLNALDDFVRLFPRPHSVGGLGASSVADWRRGNGLIEDKANTVIRAILSCQCQSMNWLHSKRTALRETQHPSKCRKSCHSGCQRAYLARMPSVQLPVHTGGRGASTSSQGKKPIDAHWLSALFIRCYDSVPFGLKRVALHGGEGGAILCGCVYCEG